MRKRILILGASGMAGHAIYYYFKEKAEYDIFSTCNRHKIDETSIMLDIYDKITLEKIIHNIKPYYIINCIGILIKESNEEPANAIYINAYFPHFLAELISNQIPSAKLIHISTDCVFSGSKGDYRDFDQKDALDIYGMTKNLGEIVNSRDLTIRTSIIGPELKKDGEGLFHWLFSQKEKGFIEGYTKAFWSGITTIQLAKAIDKSIKAGSVGLWQISNNYKISKYDLLSLIINEFKLSIRILANEKVKYDKSLICSDRKEIDYIVPSYEIMIKELYDYMFSKKNIYKYYWDKVL